MKKSKKEKVKHAPIRLLLNPDTIRGKQSTIQLMAEINLDEINSLMFYLRDEDLPKIENQRGNSVAPNKFTSLFILHKTYDLEPADVLSLALQTDFPIYYFSSQPIELPSLWPHNAPELETTDRPEGKTKENSYFRVDNRSIGELISFFQKIPTPRDPEYFSIPMHQEPPASKTLGSQSHQTIRSRSRASRQKRSTVSTTSGPAESIAVQG